MIEREDGGGAYGSHKRPKPGPAAVLVFGSFRAATIQIGLRPRNQVVALETAEGERHPGKEKGAAYQRNRCWNADCRAVVQPEVGQNLLAEDRG